MREDEQTESHLKNIAKEIDEILDGALDDYETEAGTIKIQKT